LQARERELQTLADNTPDILARFDRQMRHVFVSAAIERMTGRPPQDFIGHTARELGMPADLCDCWENAIQAAFQKACAQTVAFTYEAAGGPNHYSGRFVPEFGSEGAIDHVLAVLHDDTEQKRAEQDINRLLEEERHYARLLGRMAQASRLVHASLRTWLTSLDERRMPLAQAFAVQPATPRLASQVLRLWEETGGRREGKTEPHSFVARALWTLLKATTDDAAMGRVAFDVSLYWENRQLALAIEPGEFAASEASRAFAAGLTDAEPLARGGKCLRHLGDLHSALGRSMRALEAYRQGLAIRERLAAKDSDLLSSGNARTYAECGIRC
jgi:PAS domain S-box-containing protein